MLAATTQTLHEVGVGEPVTTVLADAGYCTDANLTAADPAGPELLMPPYNTRKDATSTKPETSGATAPPKQQSTKQRMAQELVTERGQALYRLPSQSVEPTVGQINDARSCRRFSETGTSRRTHRSAISGHSQHPDCATRSRVLRSFCPNRGWVQFSAPGCSPSSATPTTGTPRRKPVRTAPVPARSPAPPAKRRS